METWPQAVDPNRGEKREPVSMLVEREVQDGDSEVSSELMHVSDP